MREGPIRLDHIDVALFLGMYLKPNGREIAGEV
jgi:hypothetical protein